MKLDMTINYEVTDTTQEVENLLEDLVGDEARVFVDTLRRRLADAGVKDIRTSVNESS